MGLMIDTKIIIIYLVKMFPVLIDPKGITMFLKNKFHVTISVSKYCILSNSLSSWF